MTCEHYACGEKKKRFCFSASFCGKRTIFFFFFFTFSKKTKEDPHFFHHHNNNNHKFFFFTQLKIFDKMKLYSIMLFNNNPELKVPAVLASAAYLDDFMFWERSSARDITRFVSRFVKSLSLSCQIYFF